MLQQLLDSADPREVLQYIDDVQKTHNDRIRTLQVRYRFKQSWNHELLPEHLRPTRTDIPLRYDMEKEGEFGRSGEKWYSIERFTASDESGALRQSRAAFDGRLYYDRQENDVPRFASTTEPGRIRPGTPDPRQEAEWTPPSEFLKRLGTELASSAPAAARRNGHNCIELRMSQTVEPHVQVTALYDADRMFVPVAWETWHLDGSKIWEQTNDFLELMADGQTVFFPVHVQSTNYYYGQITAHHELHVDPTSIRINHPIPDPRFTITPTRRSDSNHRPLDMRFSTAEHRPPNVPPCLRASVVSLPSTKRQQIHRGRQSLPFARRNTS